MSDHCVVISTVGSSEEAREIARLLVGERLAACVQLLPIDSLYRWEGEVAESREVLLLVKTRSDLYPALEERILSLHPYETPEVLKLPVEGGSLPYLSWIDSVT